MLRVETTMCFVPDNIVTLIEISRQELELGHTIFSFVVFFSFVLWYWMLVIKFDLLKESDKSRSRSTDASHRMNKSKSQV